jgi:hypothetical protein
VSERPPLALVAADGRRIDLPLVPQTLTRSRPASGSGRIELTVDLDDRLDDGAPPTVTVLAMLDAMGDTVAELVWGERSFRVRLSSLAVTETAFGPALQPIAGTVELILEVVPDRKPPR